MPRRTDISKVLAIGAPIVLVLILAIANAANGCTIFATPVKAAPSFDLLVQDHGKPVAGIPIVVTRIGDKTGKRLLELRSGADGRVPIRGLAVGRYAIVNLGPIETGGLVATVEEGGPLKLEKPVPFDWPWQGIVQTKSLHGRLRSADPKRPFTDIEVALKTVGTGALLKTLRTGPDGHFSLGNFSPGLYVVQVHATQPGVEEGWEVAGPIAVEVVPDSPSAPDNVDLTLGETSCGIWYAHCPRRDSINLLSRRIGVSDFNGATVGSTHYVVEDAAGNEVVTGESDQEGIINLPAELRGAYKLNIFMGGFTPLEQPLDLAAPEAGARDLRVVLNVGGVCSEAKLEDHAASH